MRGDAEARLDKTNCDNATINKTAEASGEMLARSSACGDWRHSAFMSAYALVLNLKSL